MSDCTTSNVSKTFTGPVFIIGMPRSGTKLLRELLNAHPKIRIPEIESEFLPFWISRWARIGPIDSPERFSRFAKKANSLPFFVQHAERGRPVSWERWYEACETFDAAGLFAGLMKAVLSIPRDDQTLIWGDKSPSYIGHIPLLQQAFPSARFIHIIRDVRDYCLSINKAWGKSMIRAAQRWQDDVSNARSDGYQRQPKYIEVRYEDLLLQPDHVMHEICHMLEIEFNVSMLQLDSSPEDRGDAKGLTTILESNKGKYMSAMSDSCRRRIEAIACPTLRAVGYPCDHQGEPVRVSDWQLRLLQGFDGLQVLRSAVAKRGLLGALGFHVAYFKISGNRRF